MLDDEMNENERNACESVRKCESTHRVRGNPAKLKPFDSERAKKASEKRWSNSRFGISKKLIKQMMSMKIEERVEEIAKRNVEFMMQGNQEGVQAIQLGLKGIGAHSENEEKAMSMNMKVNADVKKSGTVKLVIEDMTKPEG